MQNNNTFVTNPVYKLIPRFKPLPKCEYIFTCQKNGSFPFSNLAIQANIPIQKLYFMVERSYKFLKLDEIDRNKLSSYTNIFVFENIGSGKLPKTSEEASTYKKNCIYTLRKNNMFARTCIIGDVFIDFEHQIEWVPEKQNPLSVYQKIPPVVRNELNLPHPIDENINNCLLLTDNVMNFQNESGIYVFGHIQDDKIIIRHYIPVKNEKKVSICLYVELTMDGVYFCRFYFDDEENMKFGRNTICGYADLNKLHQRIYNFDITKYIDFLEKSGNSYSNAKFQDSRIKERALYGFGGLTNDEDDEDGGDLFKFGLSNKQFLSQQDMYGDY